ncbi:MAG: PKD domain-containing protein [Flavobacteriales bacterium]|nr:PKD domain-containing protein [Flavobacteriales bacterium]MDP4716477.1 PKD domain-containing protein [Flavobacteriales bacterium]MDP4819116.1 PKD domain-containing protein [Flavobacteriales bacterium]
MKNILLKIAVLLLGVFAFFDAFATQKDSNEFLILTDTVVFDISAASYSNSGGMFYIDIPISIHSTDADINALDFWFQFNTNKMTYQSTTALVPGLDPFTNFNVNNQVLSNTTSGTSISFSTPLYTDILMIRFVLTSACTEIYPSDFFSIFALVNGNLSSHLFVGPSGIPNFEIQQPQPYCSEDEIVFNYPYTSVNGRTIQSYSWDFGNGQVSSLQSDVAIYAAEGDYSVTLTLTTTDGCIYSVQNIIPIYPSPVAAFSSSWDEPTNVVSFTNESTISSGSINFYNWDFGTSTSNLQNPDYTFPIPDYYNVTLTATSDLGCTNSITQLVTAIDIVELDYRNFSLFPNPASTILQVESNFQAHVRVVDASGRLLTQNVELLPNRMTTLNISMLSDGLYFLECVENQSVYRERFMVQH